MDSYVSRKESAEADHIMHVWTQAVSLGNPLIPDMLGDRMVFVK